MVFETDPVHSGVDLGAEQIEFSFQVNFRIISVRRFAFRRRLFVGNGTVRVVHDGVFQFALDAKRIAKVKRLLSPVGVPHVGTRGEGNMGFLELRRVVRRPGVVPRLKIGIEPRDESDLDF